MKRLALAALLLCACTRPDVRLLSPTAMALLPDGAVAVADGVLAGIVAVEPSGARRLLSGRGVGAGPPLSEPEALALGTGLVVADRHRLLEVDLATGNRRDLGVEGLRRPVALAFADGALWVVDEQARTLLSSGRVVSGPERGAGEVWRQPAGLALDGPRALVADPGTGRLFSVDLESGDRSVVAEGLLEPEAVAVSGGRWFVADIDGDRILEVRPGRVTELSGPSRGSGPPLPEPHDLAVTGGALLVLDMAAGGLIRVDLGTGARSAWPPGSLP